MCVRLVSMCARKFLPLAPKGLAAIPPSSAAEYTVAMTAPKKKREVESGPMEDIQSQQNMVRRDGRQDCLVG